MWISPQKHSAGVSDHRNLLSASSLVLPFFPPEPRPYMKIAQSLAESSLERQSLQQQQLVRIELSPPPEGPFLG